MVLATHSGQPDHDRPTARQCDSADRKRYADPARGPAPNREKFAPLDEYRAKRIRYERKRDLGSARNPHQGSNEKGLQRSGQEGGVQNTNHQHPNKIPKESKSNTRTHCNGTNSQAGWNQADPGQQICRVGSAVFRALEFGDPEDYQTAAYLQSPEIKRRRNSIR